MSTSDYQEMLLSPTVSISSEALRTLVAYVELNLSADSELLGKAGHTPSEQLAEEFLALELAKSALEEIDAQKDNGATQRPS